MTTPKQSPGDMLTTNQAAEACGISRTHWNNLAAENNIGPAHRLPGRTGAKLWRRRDVTAIGKVIAAQALAGAK